MWIADRRSGVGMLDIRQSRPESQGSAFRSLPATQVGRCAGALAVAFAGIVTLWLAASKLHSDPAMAVTLGALRLAPLCGGAAAILALIALLTRREHSWFVWLGLVPGLLMLGVVALELLWME
jgi:hypothetical protein